MNRKEFKNAMSGVQPSEQTIERIMDMTGDKTKKRIKFAPAIALVACLAILVTGIFGGSVLSAKLNPAINHAGESNIPTATIGNSSAVSKIAQGFVMVAYANDDKKSIEIVEDINNLNLSTNYLCKIEVTDIRNMSEKEIEKIVSNKPLHYYITGEKECGKVYYQCILGTERLENTLIGQAYCGAFDFDLDKDTVKDVKEIRVSNKNADYGIMEIQARDCIFDDNLVMIENKNDYIKDMYMKSNSQSLDGNRYRKCMNLNEEFGGKYFGIIWKMNDSLFDAIDENPDFDLTTVKDTITFEVEFNDGSISKSVIDVAFDKNGEMYAVNSQYDFIK